MLLQPLGAKFKRMVRPTHFQHASYAKTKNDKKLLIIFLYKLCLRVRCKTVKIQLHWTRDNLLPARPSTAF